MFFGNVDHKFGTKLLREKKRKFEIKPTRNETKRGDMNLSLIPSHLSSSLFVYLLWLTSPLIWLLCLALQFDNLLLSKLTSLVSGGHFRLSLPKFIPNAGLSFCLCFLLSGQTCRAFCSPQWPSD